MKLCNKCNQLKSVSEFKKHTETKDKLTGSCKECLNTAQRINRKLTNNSCTRKYEKTKHGFLVRCYRNMLSRISGVQKKKAHLYTGKTILDKFTFYSWSINSIEFNLLFDNWEKNGYIRKETPSIDRIDSSGSYELGNIRWITFLENSRLGALSKKRRINKFTEVK